MPAPVNSIAGHEYAFPQTVIPNGDPTVLRTTWCHWAPAAFRCPNQVLVDIEEALSNVVSRCNRSGVRGHLNGIKSGDWILRRPKR